DKMQLVAVHARVTRDRHVARTAEPRIHRSLGRQARRHANRVQRREQRARRRIVVAALDADDALPDRRHELIDLEARADALAEAEPIEAGAGEQDRIELAFVELAQTRADVAAQLGDLQIGTARAQLRLATQARGADTRAMRQRIDAVESCADERIARIGRFEERGEREPLRQMHRDVFHRMHCDVGAPLGHRLLQLLHEQALAAGLLQRRVEEAIAARGHRHELDDEPGVRALEQPFDVARLPERERAFARRDAQRLRSRARHPSTGLSTSARRTSARRRRLTAISVLTWRNRSQCTSSSSCLPRSRPMMKRVATRALRCTRRNHAAKSSSSLLSDSSISTSPCRWWTVVYFWSARK